ncbi:MAG: hypothetical protein HRU22_10935 [Gammaproteobacteria bacterium]|nr:hypothetical protein [Gammaproteobacteria bacterium]
MSTERDRQLLVELYLDQMPKLATCDQYNLSPMQFDRLHYREKSRLKRILLEHNSLFI